VTLLDQGGVATLVLWRVSVIAGRHVIVLCLFLLWLG
jgi:hypothetical protein